MNPAATVAQQEFLQFTVELKIMHLKRKHDALVNVTFFVDKDATRKPARWVLASICLLRRRLSAAFSSRVAGSGNHLDVTKLAVPQVVL